MKLSTKIDEFARLVNAGIEAWTQAGQILNEMIDEDETTRQKIMERIPWMTIAVLCGFERIGRGEIYPHLLLDKSPGAHALIALPFDEQKRLHSASLALAVYRKGEIVTEHRRLQDLTEKEANLVFTETAVRPVAEQSKILLSKIRGKSNVRGVARAVDVQPEESDEQETESLEDDSSETAEYHLAKAQAALIMAREIMERDKVAGLGQYVTQALNAIGNLRFRIKEQILNK